MTIECGASVSPLGQRVEGLAVPGIQGGLLRAGDLNLKRAVVSYWEARAVD